MPIRVVVVVYDNVDFTLFGRAAASISFSALLCSAPQQPLHFTFDKFSWFLCCMYVFTIIILLLFAVVACLVSGYSQGSSGEQVAASQGNYTHTHTLIFILRRWLGNWLDRHYHYHDITLARAARSFSTLKAQRRSQSAMVVLVVVQHVRSIAGSLIFNLEPQLPQPVERASEEEVVAQQ